MNWYLWYSWNNSLVAEKIWLVRVQDSMEQFWGTDSGLCVVRIQEKESQVSIWSIHRGFISNAFPNSFQNLTVVGMAKPSLGEKPDACKMCSCSGNVLQRATDPQNGKVVGPWIMSHCELMCSIKRHQDLLQQLLCPAPQTPLGSLSRMCAVYSSVQQCTAVYSANSRSAKCKGLDEMV